MSLNIASIDWAEEKEMIQTSAHKQTKACVLDTRVNEVLPACRTPQKILFQNNAYETFRCRGQSM